MRVISTISTQGIELDTASFSKSPYSITTDGDQTVIEWRFEYFPVNLEEDIGFDVLLKNPVAGEQRLVSQKLELFYNDVNGNPVRTELGPQYVNVLASTFEGSISTDKTIYQANQNVNISAAIKNLSDYSGTIDAKILIEDSTGTLVKEITTISNVNFDTGEIKNFDNLVFNTGSTYAGDYKAHLILYENQTQIGEATADFKIQQPTIALNSKVAVDKLIYGPSENVTIISQATSLCPNYILENLTATVSVISTRGSVLATETRNITTLMPEASITFKTYWNTGTNPAGAYPVTLEVKDATGAVIATSSASLTILSSSSTGAGFTGAITVNPNPVFQGREETLTYSITNSGNEDANSLTAIVTIADPDTGEAKASYTKQYSINKGASISDTQVAQTLNLAPKIYLAVLQIQTPGMTAAKTLASASFEVKPGIEASKAIADQKRVLIWLNYPWQSGQNCPDRTQIEQALTNAGIMYHIVLDKDDFEKEFRNSLYTDIMILGNHNPIEDHFSEELREQVYAGRGLVSSLFDRQNLNEEVFGITYSGSLSGEDYAVVLQGNDLNIQGTFQSLEKAVKVEALNSADIIGSITETTGKKTVQYPAIIKNQYGKGKALFFAFDLGMSSGVMAFEALLSETVNFIHTPIDPAAIGPDMLVPVELTIKSLGAAFSLRVTETYPEGAEIYDATLSRISDNPWVSNIELASNETGTALYYVRVPDQAGSTIYQTEVAYLENGLYIPYQTHEVEITTTQSTADALNNATAELEALVLSGQEAASRDKAIRSLNAAQDRIVLTEADREAMITDLRDAASELVRITSQDVSDIRLKVDFLMMYWEGESAGNRG